MSCERLTDLLEQDGTHVVLGSANTFDAAVQAVTANRTDILMLDLTLQQGTGTDVLAEAKRRVAGVLGIVVSNHLTARDRKAAIDGMASYLHKKAGQAKELLQPTPWYMREKRRIELSVAFVTDRSHSCRKTLCAIYKQSLRDRFSPACCGAFFSTRE